VYRLRQTETFADWLGDLRDAKAKARILARLESARLGNLGDTRTLGGGIHEMRLHVGPGYRVYFALRHGAVLLLLCGDAKSRQTRNIERAGPCWRNSIGSRAYGSRERVRSERLS
jgi:putative addiction module killer protein